MASIAITQIDVFQVDSPYAGGTYYLSLGREYTAFDATIVRITPQNGIEGWGESTPFGATFVAAHALGVRAGIAEIAPALIGLDPRRVDRINDVMDATLVGHEHTPRQPWMLPVGIIFRKSQLVSHPVCELLGGRTDDYFAAHVFYRGVYTPETMRTLVADYRAKGFMGHSIKIGGDPEIDAGLITSALTDKKPGEFFLADANGELAVEIALRMLRLLPEGLDFVLESPCASWRENTSLRRRRTNIPIIYDELATNSAATIQLIADDAAEGIHLKISKCGGLTKARRIRDVCLAAGYTMSVQDAWGSDVSFAAIVHLAQTIPSRALRCILDVRNSIPLKTAECTYGTQDGQITAPQTAGLGVSPCLEVLGAPVASYS